MDPLHTAHLVVLSAWGGLVAAEGVLEVGARDDEALAHATRQHFWLDLLVEAPLLLGVLVTGALLTLRSLPLTSLHALKVGAGLVAVAANVYCVAVVVRRYVARADRVAVRRHSARIRLVAPTIGLPFAAVAAYVGLAYFAR